MLRGDGHSYFGGIAPGYEPFSNSIMYYLKNGDFTRPNEPVNRQIDLRKIFRTTHYLFVVSSTGYSSRDKQSYLKKQSHPGRGNYLRVITVHVFLYY